MIFAAVAEELGFLGVILVLCLFAAFVGEGFRIAQRATSDFVRLTATGLTALIGFQAFFIMAGVLRLLPFTGITLPFMAYGANSLIANYVLVAILLRISDEENTERRGGEVLVRPARALSWRSSAAAPLPRRGSAREPSGATPT